MHLHVLCCGGGFSNVHGVWRDGNVSDGLLRFEKT